VVVAADGALSFTALKAGLRRPKFNIDQVAVGVKALIDLPRMSSTTVRAFCTQGMANEYVGCTAGIRGGGFLYTNYDTVSVGLVVHLGSLRESGKTPYDLLNASWTSPRLPSCSRVGGFSSTRPMSSQKEGTT